MTGGEAIVVKGSQAVYGKVRMDGDTLCDFCTHKRCDSFSGSPLQFWKEYMRFRTNKFGPPTSTSEIQSRFDPQGFEFTVQDHFNKSAEELHRIAKTELDIATQNDRSDGYICGYDDYFFVIRLDQSPGHRVEDVYDQGNY